MQSDTIQHFVFLQCTWPKEEWGTVPLSLIKVLYQWLGSRLSKSKAWLWHQTLEYSINLEHLGRIADGWIRELDQIIIVHCLITQLTGATGNLCVSVFRALQLLSDRRRLQFWCFLFRLCNRKGFWKTQVNSLWKCITAPQKSWWDEW